MKEDKVWVGNLGAYNEGKLVGDWLELPYDEGSLRNWLREHVGIGEARWDGGTYEEYEAFDTDFCGPLGRIDAETRDLHHCSLSQLNALARIAAGLNEAQLAAVEAYLETEGTGKSSEAANAMLQADEIAFTPFPQSRPAKHYYGSDAQALEWSGELEDLALSDKTLMEYIDPVKVGEDEEQCGVFGDDVFVDTAASDEPDEMDRADIISAAEHCGTMTTRRLRGESAAALAEEARVFLKDHRCFPEHTHDRLEQLLADDPELSIACADIIADMDVPCPEAVLAYWDAEVSDWNPKALAELVLQADKLVHTELEGDRKWNETIDDANIRRLGETVIEELGGEFTRDELERFFDGERYANDLLTCGEFAVTTYGVLDNGATDVELDKYSWDEIMESARTRRLEEIAVEYLYNGDFPATDDNIAAVMEYARANGIEALADDGFDMPELEDNTYGEEEPGID